MNQLASKRCVACRKDGEPTSEQDQSVYMDSLIDWETITVNDVQHLSRTFTFKNFVDALAFTNGVGDLAEAEDHHPALLTEWGKVQVTWWTHSIAGLHDNDFILAARTAELYGNSRQITIYD